MRFFSNTTADWTRPPWFDGLANGFQWVAVSTRMRRLLFGVCNPW